MCRKPRIFQLEMHPAFRLDKRAPHATNGDMKAKRILLTICLAAFSLCAYAEHATKVVGVINLEDMKAAWLEMRDSPTNGTFSSTTRQLVKEGDIFTDQQIKGAHVQIEIVRIDFSNGMVQAKENGTEATYQFKSGGNAVVLPAQSGIYFNDATLNSALDMLGMITRRTLLVHPDVYATLAPVSIQARDKAGFTGAFETFLKEKDIAVVLDGSKFEMVFPASLGKTFQPFAQSVSAPETNNSTSGYGLSYDNVDLRQVLNFYGQVIGRELAQDWFPVGACKIRTQTLLTKAEVVHAIDVLMAFHELKAINIGDKSFKVVSLSSGRN